MNDIYHWALREWSGRRPYAFLGLLLKAACILVYVDAFLLPYKGSMSRLGQGLLCGSCR